MGVEVRPLGVTCNIQCQYCYQNPQRDAGNLLRTYDVGRMLSAIEQEGGPFTLFGGEALMVAKPDLETLWAWGLEKFGTNGIQTNGVLIDDDHIDLFKRYRVNVGISIDGPGALNDVRWGGSLEQTRANTAKTEAAIERLCREGIPPSLIVTLSRCNATGDKLPVMHEWFRTLEGLGVQSARLHVLEVESEAVRAKYALSIEENLRALLSFVELERDLTSLKLDLFQDMRRLLLGQDASTTCVWNACDPYTTTAVRGVEGNGQRSNCGRTNKDGIDFVKADTAGFERYLALYHTPQEFGGCKGCRFFLQCKGQCPGTAIDGDWRNRTEHCLLWKQVFREIEERLIDEGHLPLSVNPDRKQVELSFVKSWAAGRNTTIQQALTDLGLHADGDRAASRASSHGDVSHGDAPHGDSTAREQGALAPARTETPHA
jgi:uncharacterized protein